MTCLSCSRFAALATATLLSGTPAIAQSTSVSTEYLMTVYIQKDAALGDTASAHRNIDKTGTNEPCCFAIATTASYHPQAGSGLERGSVRHEPKRRWRVEILHRQSEYTGRPPTRCIYGYYTKD
jgi:hypothetical protein